MDLADVLVTSLLIARKRDGAAETEPPKLVRNLHQRSLAGYGRLALQYKRFYRWYINQEPHFA